MIWYFITNYDKASQDQNHRNERTINILTKVQVVWLYY